MTVGAGMKRPKNCWGGGEVKHSDLVAIVTSLRSRAEESLSRQGALPWNFAPVVLHLTPQGALELAEILGACAKVSRVVDGQE